MNRNNLNDIKEIDFIMADIFPYTLITEMKSGEFLPTHHRDADDLIEEIKLSAYACVGYRAYHIDISNNRIIDVRVELYEPKKEAV